MCCCGTRNRGPQRENRIPVLRCGEGVARVSVYIAGPMTGIPQFNYPAFAYAATVLRAQGRKVVSPHEIDNGVVPTSYDAARPYEWYLRHALKALLECDEIVMLAGWEQSVGARLERQVAEALKMPVSEWAGSA